MKSEKEKGAKEAPNIERSNNNSKDNDYFLPFNYVNLLRFDLGVFSLLELCMLNTFIVKASNRRGNGNNFIYSFSDARKEFDIDDRIYLKILRKFECFDLIERGAKDKANNRHIRVNFKTLTETDFFEQIVKESKYETKFEAAEKIRFTVEKHRIDSENIDAIKRLNDKNKDEIINARAVNEMVVKISEVFRRRRQSSYKDGIIVPESIQLSFSTEQRSKLKDAVILHGKQTVINASEALFHSIFSTGYKSISPAGMLLKTDEKGEFVNVIYWNNEFSTSYSFKKKS